MRCLSDYWYATDPPHPPPNASADSSSGCAPVVLFIKDYSLKRVTVQGSRRFGNGKRLSGAVTPDTREPSSEPPEKPQTIEEGHSPTPRDLEKGSNGSEDGTVDVKYKGDEGWDVVIKTKKSSHGK